MLPKINLQTKLILGFLFMGLIVLTVAIIGWQGTYRLSQHINQIGTNNLPSIVSLLMVHQGQTQVQSSEKALLNPLLTLSQRQEEKARISTAWQQIEKGFKAYEPLPQTATEKQLYEEAQKAWTLWTEEHQKFITLNEDFESLGIYNPRAKQLELWQKGLENSPEMTKATEASQRIQVLQNQSLTVQDRFLKAEMALLQVTNNIQEQAQKSVTKANADISNTRFWVVLGMTIGPVTAVVLGVFLSIVIARPIDRTLKGIVQMILSSTSEISATLEEQERIASTQASSVNQTTTTMDELGSSARQASEQASAVAEGTQQVLALAETGMKGVDDTLTGMDRLQNQVKGIGQQLNSLLEQAGQIGSINNVVSDLANQTNMLALNAAVEAVRAGEHGKGFSVVATEIRKLADQSKQSAQQINRLIQDVQTVVNATVHVTNQGITMVQENAQTVEETASVLTRVKAGIDQAVLNAQQISLTVKQQSIAITQVITAMSNLNQGAKETATGMTQTRISTQNLQEAAKGLKSLGS